MKNFLLLIAILIALNGVAQTVITVSDTIKSDVTWSADTIKVMADIYIADSATLTINAGTYVEFQGHYKLKSQGKIAANGALNKIITFTARDTLMTNSKGGWGGIKLIYSKDTSTFNYCLFSFANDIDDNEYFERGMAITAYYSVATIKNCTITRNKSTYYSHGAIKLNESNSTVENCIIFNNDNNGIQIQYSNAQIIKNIIQENNTAITVYGESCYIFGNLIYNNYTGIALDNSPSKIINNTIADNNRGVNLSYNTPEVTNCIIANNTDYDLYNYKSNAIITYSNIGDELKDGLGNTSIDPKFIGNGQHPYSLHSSSTCINAGDKQLTIDSLNYKTDIAGNNRIFTQTQESIIDMGAYEYQNDPAPYLYADSLALKYLRANEPFAQYLNIHSSPVAYSTRILSTYPNVQIKNDTLFWTPSTNDEGKYFTFSVELKNASKTDTITFDVYVLKNNEYYTLPNKDVTWSSDTIKVLGNLTISDTTTLTINKGVYIEFQDNYRITVHGNLIAIGNALNPIIFTPKNSNNKWGGIRFYNINYYNDSSKLIHCQINHTNALRDNTWANYNAGAIYIESFNKILLSHCSIYDSKSDNDNNAINCRYADIQIENCLISNIGGSGISLDYSNSLLLNNTISNENGSSIYLRSSKPIIKNCILHNSNNRGLYMYNSMPLIENCNISGFKGNDNGNFDADPKFIGSGDHPFSLTGTSPCINNGNINFTADSLYLPTDLAGNTRIYTDNEKTIDIGAYEYQAVPDYFISHNEFEKAFIKVDSNFVFKPVIFSHPKIYSLSLLNAPQGAQISNGILSWKPNINQARKTHKFGIHIENGAVKDTIHLEIYVLSPKDYIELTDSTTNWSDTIYVLNDLELPYGYKLNINPGTYVEFKGNYALYNYGSIMALGTADKRITFTAADTVLTDTSGGWKGIRNNSYNTQDSSSFMYCIFEYGNLFENKWSETSGSAISWNNNSKLSIGNSIFRHNKTKSDYNYVIDISNCSPVLQNNIIANNNSSGISFTSSNAKFSNNTVANNKWFNVYLGWSMMTIKNNIIRTCVNSNLFLNDDESKKSTITYNNIEGLNIVDIQEPTNIDIDPLFINNDSLFYGLGKTSPCLNAGDPSYTQDSLISSYDVVGLSRIYNGLERIIDMGAYELQSDPDPFLFADTIKHIYAKENQLFLKKIKSKSFPTVVSYKVLAAPSGFTVVHDTIKWEPTNDQGGKTYNISLEANNSVLKDTLDFTVYVLKENEFAFFNDKNMLWSSDTVRIYDNILVPNLKTLTINPGTYVEFQGNYEIKVEGRLLAQGNASNRITFTAKDSTLRDNSGGWNGINFYKIDTLNNTSIIQFCNLKYGNTFRWWEKAVGSAILCQNSDEVIISNNIFTNNDCNWNGGIIYLLGSDVKLENNLIVNNESIGIECWYSNSHIKNNTIANNNYGIKLYASNPILTNNIIAYNNITNFYADNGCNPTIEYCNILGSKLNKNGNMDLDPLFLGGDSATYSLQNTSPCLNAGKPDFTIDSLLVTTDVNGENRIFKGTVAKIDMGAYELQSEPENYIKYAPITPQLAKINELYSTNLNIYSYPTQYTIDIIEAPDGLSIVQNTLNWTPTLQQVDSTHLVSLKINTSELTDTLTFSIYVLGVNDFIELPATDLTWSDTIRVFDNLKLAENSTLTIMPGTCIEFQGHYEINVKGNIIAKGKPAQRITFTCVDTILSYKQGGWQGIRFEDSWKNTDSSFFEYCIFEYGNAYGDNYYEGYGGAIYAYNYYNLTFNNNIVQKTNASGTGTVYFDWSHTNLYNNLFVDNYTTAVYSNSYGVEFSNNTIVNNDGYGIRLSYGEARITNNIIWGNSNESLSINETDIYASNNNIEGDQDGIYGALSTDPMFELKGNFPYMLKQSSPLINAGTPQITMDSLNVKTDLKGGKRIKDGRIDIGAYESGSNIANFPGVARAYASSFTINNCAYIGLGRSEDTVLNDFWMYDQNQDVWSSIADFPGAPRNKSVAFTINGKAYVGLGGSTQGWETTYYKDFYEYTPETNTWKQVADFGGTARLSAVAFAIDETGYVGTGNDENGATNNFWQYSPASNTWTTMPEFTSHARNSAVAFVVNKKGYVSGGQEITSSGTRVLSDVQEYNPATKTWTETVFADGLNLSINSATAIAVGSKGYICYGNKQQVVSYKPSTNQIENLGDVLGLNADRSGAVSFVIGDSVCFGLGKQGFWETTYMNDILVMNLPANFLPTDINVSNASVNENTIATIAFAKLKTSDKNSDDTFTYEFVNGENDNAYFNINKDSLYITNSPNYEEKQLYNIHIKSTDSDGEWIEKNIDIHINDINEAPIQLILSNDTIFTNDTIETVIGWFSAFDEDLNDTITFSFTSDGSIIGADTNYFEIRDSNLVLTDVVNDENEYYQFLVKASDRGKLSTIEHIVLKVIEGVGIKRLQNASKAFNIYPNPTNGLINMKLLNTDVQVSQIKLLNTNGSLVKSFNASQSISQLNISEFKSGIYFMVIETNKGLYYHKIILE